MLMIDAILLAAGSSVRMGSVNKLTLNFGEQTVLATVISHLKRSKVDRINVVVGHEHDQIIKQIDNDSDVQIIYNSIHRKGQMSSIQAAMGQVRDQSDGFMICLGDMPSITPEEYNYIIDNFSDIKRKQTAPIVRPVYKESVGHPVIFDPVYKHTIIDQSHQSKCQRIIDQHRDSFIAIPVSSVNYFLDIDNEEDYNRLIQYASPNE